ncbi:MAG: hypothetical protein JSV04_03785 [Candidatus Heimdallarchaeota archaeon]|nr:MAG: hypothetical protein JSV04_03785 [Candidatus Heimdallarchaeota archaeon]
MASSLGSVEACPQRVHTSNSCCPSCSIFLEHGSDAMLTHWKDQAQFMAGFLIVIPLTLTEEVIRSAFRLHKVPITQLRILYEWKNTRTLDIVFERHINWVMTIRHTYWPLDLYDPFLRDPLIFGLAGFPARAGATLFSQLRSLFEDLKTWLIENYQVDPLEIFNGDQQQKNYVSYFASYFLRFENAENLTVHIMAPDYEKSDEPETCLVTIGDNQIPVVEFQKINNTLVMQKGLVNSWLLIEPALQKMLDELTNITAEMRTVTKLTVIQLSALLDETQSIQAQFLKLKPAISNMQGHLSPMVPLLSEGLIPKLFPSFNINLMNSWIDFAKSVERSVEGATSYIQGKMNILALEQEKRTTVRLNLLTALFGCLSGLNLLVALLAWYSSEPTDEIFFGTILAIIVLITLTLLFVGRVVSRG